MTPATAASLIQAGNAAAKQQQGLGTGYGNSSGGFFNTVGGQILGAFLGPLASDAMNREMTANENELSRQHDANMARISQNYALDQMALANKYNIEMDSTKYQRQIADMVAAGLNPASIAGSAIAGANVHGSNAIGSSGGRSGILGYSSSGNPLGSMMSSAMNAMLAKSEKAANIAKQELVDNARHMHRMEELNESMKLNQAKLASIKASDKLADKWTTYKYGKVKDDDILNDKWIQDFEKRHR